MSTPSDSPRENVPSNTPLADRLTLVAEALTNIISGRPLPEQLRAPSFEIARPASTEAGIQRILAGPSIT